MRNLLKPVYLMLGDLIVLNLGALLALALRFDGAIPLDYLRVFGLVALPYTALSLLIFHLFGMYSSLWKYSSFREVSRLVLSVLVSTGALALLVYLPPLMVQRPHLFPRSVLITTILTNASLVAGLRYGKVLLLSSVESAVPRQVHIRRALIYGAGEAGAIVVRELARHSELGVEVVGFLDDEPAKHGRVVANIPVLGGRDQLAQILKERAIGEVVIAMPSAPRQTLRELHTTLVSTGVQVKIVPGIYEVLSGRISFSQIREVQIEDLLGRESIDIDMTSMGSYLRGRRVLITGAGGSIGSELCRQVALFEPAMLILLDHEENGIFEGALELDVLGLRCPKHLSVADVCDEEKVHRVFERWRPDVVFHAAAHKHVPLMEEHPEEAIKTNVFGTRIVAREAVAFGASRFILVSTDKAVNPTSVMGSSKRVAEMVVQSMNQHGITHFAAVRFGNVLGSRGSVIPIFKRQISRGGPVTVTHPDVTRFFMTIPEAVRLIIQAGGLAKGGETFILDMGEPVRILDLAENLIRLSGLEPGVDIKIEFTGLRPGEKLYEELMYDEEKYTRTAHPRILVSNAVVDRISIADDKLDALLGHATSGDGEAIRRVLLEVVPSYKWGTQAHDEVAASRQGSLNTENPVTQS
ncbi:MAG: polysaccharide biosynthesis protein [Chloroflexi bacterium]|nr:polysaccharide biosynthesis protein [Chloroflexota bacterium]